MGKGDKRRPSSVTREEYEENFEAIFGRKEIKTWDPEAEAQGDDGSQVGGDSGERREEGPTGD